MQIEELTNCCGVQLISGLGNTTSSFALNTTKEEVEEFILNKRKESYMNKIQMIVLNEVQLKFFTRKMFLNLGFKIRCIGLYNGHGNELYTLFYNANGNF